MWGEGRRVSTFLASSAPGIQQVIDHQVDTDYMDRGQCCCCYSVVSYWGSGSPGFCLEMAGHCADQLLRDWTYIRVLTPGGP
ncbi:hypothetical protein RRG08_062620 [Elysia crispata]|uniref:Uncharacterized protein n=1 Tax=Elysia crispata TaxID=231223 RepID=A0AAE0YY86_9GAST|nr:hypothetical protein RRG08_062620 [Elysia crispata]